MPFTNNNNILLIIIIIVISLFIYFITITQKFEFFEADVNTILLSEYNTNVSNVKDITSSLSSDISVLSNNFRLTPNSPITSNALRDVNYISNYINTNAANYLNYDPINDKYKTIYNKIYQLVTDNNTPPLNYSTAL